MRQIRTQERLAAFLTLLLAGGLVAYAASAAQAARRVEPAAKAPKVTALKAPFAIVAGDTNKTKSPPVKGDEARPADEPASPTAFSPLRTSRPAKAPVAPAAKARQRTIKMEVTAYCACTECCGPNARGVTASGKRVSYNGGRFVAADTSVLPFGKKLSIPGYNAGKPVEVADRGGAIKGNRLDVYFRTHQQALQWGRQWLNVTVYE